MIVLEEQYVSIFAVVGEVTLCFVSVFVETVDAIKRSK
jgi:hypothetical protein